MGETVDSEGRRGFVLTLATREQHIRRERATSNICTNQGLCLLMATVYLALLGRVGLRRLAELNLAKAEYAKSRVRETRGPRLPLAAPTFNEFVVAVAGGAEAALARARERGIVGGLDLAAYAAELRPRPCWSAPPSSRAARPSTGWSPRWRETPRERATRRRDARSANTGNGFAYEEPLLFERSRPGRAGYSLPALDVPAVDAAALLPEGACATTCPASPSSPRWTWCGTSRGSPPGTPRSTSASTRSAPAR